MIAIGFYHMKNQINVGEVLRAADAFGASLIVLEGARFRRVPTDVTSAYRHIPLLRRSLKGSFPVDCVPVAVEMTDDAQDLSVYEHPDNPFYIFGPEDGTLGRPVTDWCRDVIQIPSRICLNLAAAVNVVLYDREAKERQKRAALIHELCKPIRQPRFHVPVNPKEKGLV